MGTQPIPPAAPAAPPARAPARRWIKRVLVVLLVLVLLLAGYAAALYFWAGGRVRTIDAFDDYPGRPDAGKGTNWLLVGSDSRARLTPEQRRALHVGGDHGLNTDTIMVLHYGSHGPYLVSLPRDSYVSIPGHGKNKINAAFALGGPKLLTRTVEQATGLRLGHYEEISFLGLVDVVNQLGGVRICVPRGGLHDPKSGADFAAGCRHMNGVQALAYVRARYTDPQGDLGRVRRQRQLVSAVGDKALSAPVVLNPWKHIPFTETVLDALTVDQDTGIGALVRMGIKTRDLAHGKGATTTVPVASGTFVAGVGDVLIWDQAGARRLFGALEDDRALPRSSP